MESTLPPLQNDFERVPLNFTTGMHELVFYHRINTILGAVCTVIAGINAFVFIGSVKFRKIYKILTALAFADLINTIAMMTMGINRQMLYNDVINTLTIPIRNSWQCAIEPWLWLKIIGDLWPPIIQLCMGLERACSLIYPVFFREKVDRNSKYVILSTMLFVVIALVVGFGLAFEERFKTQMYYCGRKAAFSKGYGTFIYATNVLFYVIGFLFNLLAYWKAASLKKSTQDLYNLTAEQLTFNKLFRNRSTHLKKIRYYLFISFFSTFLVSVPNLISLSSSWIKEVDDAISKPAVWMSGANSALSPFVYFAFNRDYRQRCFNLIEFGHHHGDGSKFTMPAITATRTKTAQTNRTAVM